MPYLLPIFNAAIPHHQRLLLLRHSGVPKDWAGSHHHIQRLKKAYLASHLGETLANGHPTRKRRIGVHPHLNSIKYIVYILWFPESWRYPQLSLIFAWDCPWNKPSSYWGTIVSGNPHIQVFIFDCRSPPWIIQGHPFRLHEIGHAVDLALFVVLIPSVGNSTERMVQHELGVPVSRCHENMPTCSSKWKFHEVSTTSGQESGYSETSGLKL